MLSQHTYEGKVAIFFIEIEAVTNYEISWDIKANIFAINFNFSRFWLT